MEKVKQGSKHDLSALGCMLIAPLLSGCLKTEYPNEQECQPTDHPYEVSRDRDFYEKALDRFGKREAGKRYFAPTTPSNADWALNEGLLLDGQSFSLEFSETEGHWQVLDSDGGPVGSITLSVNTVCRWAFQIELVMDAGERAIGTLEY